VNFNDILGAASFLKARPRRRLEIQADDDYDVPFDQSVQLTRALREERVPHESIVIPTEIHDL
jgi:dipeptidyl aminopeptidase/acylaminoacyl peptidase